MKAQQRLPLGFARALILTGVILGMVAQPLAAQDIPPVAPFDGFGEVAPEVALEPDAPPVVAGEAWWSDPVPESAPLEGGVAAAEANAGITFAVNTLVDEWSTESDVAKRAATKCSLREALQATVTTNAAGNQGCGPQSGAPGTEYTITLIPGTYLLSYQDVLPYVGKKVTIDGKGGVTIDGGGKQGRKYGIFIIGSSGNLILKKMKLQYGFRPFGGALLLQGGSNAIVNAEEVEFYRNLADNGPTTGDGGAVAVDSGTFVCKKCKFVENTARQAGGAISGGGAAMSIQESEFIKNLAELKGGAMAITGGSETTHAVVLLSKFKENKVYQVAGTEPLCGNGSPGGDGGGGALWVGGAGYIELVKTEFVKNTAQRTKGGGAIYNQGDVRLTDVAIADNKAMKDGAQPNTMGGGILNDGVVIATRISIHGNEAAFGGGIMNRTSGNLFMANSTVADNQADSGGGIENGYKFKIGNQNCELDGGDVSLQHVTAVRAVDAVQESVNLSNYGSGTIQWGNSLIDSECIGTLTSWGGNVFKKFCQRISGDNNVNLTLLDVLAQNAGEIKLGGLSNNGGVSLPEAGFLSVKPEGTSPAVDSGQDPWCGNPDNLNLMQGKDQVLATRPNGPLCDSGSMEVGTNPPQWDSETWKPEEGGFFPVNVSGKVPQTQQTLSIYNKGGGVITWKASWKNNGEYIPGWRTFDFADGQVTEGTLSANQKTDIVMTCQTFPLEGWNDGELIIETNLEDMKVIKYPASCKRILDPQKPVAGAKQRPGARSAGEAPVNGTAKTELDVQNLGTAQTMQLNYNIEDALANTMQVLATPGLVAADVPDDAILGTNGVINVPPGQSVHFEIRCKPTGLGLFTGRFVIQTNDPIEPVMEYGISCEGVAPIEPEKVLPGAKYEESPLRQLVGLALSPENNMLLGGHWNGSGISVWSVNAQNGSMAQLGTLTRPGHTVFPAIDFSPDGKNAYAASFGGNGILSLSRDPAMNTISVSQVITTGTKQICGINPIQFCDFGGMMGARGIDVSGDGQNVYLAGFNDGTLTVFRRDPATGNVTRLQRFDPVIDGVDVMGGAIGVLATADGQSVYVTGRTADTVAIFQRMTDGRLNFIHRLHDGDDPDAAGPLPAIDGLDGAQDVVESPDGRFIYVVGYDDDKLAIFERAADGFLTFIKAVPVADGPYAMSMSHDLDGARLIVSSWKGDAVELLSRDRETGDVKPLQTVFEGLDSPTLNGAVNVVSSSNDRNVFVALYEGKGIRHFASLHNTPAIAQISPASAEIGDPALEMTVKGANFFPNSESVVFLNATQLQTKYVSPHQLDATVPANLLTVGAVAQVTVRTTNPNGTLTSNAVPFQILPVNVVGVPSIESINPPEAQFGNEPLNVVLTGANFAPISQALLNGVPVKTTYISPSTLLVELLGSDLVSPGPLAITVVNGAVGVLAADSQAAPQSAAVKFTTAAANSPAAPSISGFEPGSVYATGVVQTVSVKGFNFSTLPGAVTEAWLNGAPRVSTVVDDKTLLMTLTAADVAAAGNRSVQVFTPGFAPSDAVTLRVLAPGTPPVPSLTAYNLEFSGPRITLSGSDFMAGAAVLVNGAARAATFVNPYVVSAALTSAEVAKGVSVRVQNPGGNVSNGIVTQPAFLLPPIKMYLPNVEK